VGTRVIAEFYVGLHSLVRLLIHRARRAPYMGVDHGGTWGQVPPEFGVGDTSANCPPQIFVI